MCVCVACVCVCVHGCVCVCMYVFMLYVLNFEQMCIPRMCKMCKCLGPMRVSRSKYQLLLKKALCVQLPQPGLSQWLMFWFLMMVFPYGMLGLFAWSLRSAHTITHLVVMATCLFQTLFELSFLSSCVMQGRWRCVVVVMAPDLSCFWGIFF